ncbi:MAG: putative toxin-antitoxin system toxin component, PIN family [Leptolyngbyaceae cyanobacterium]
MAIDEQRFVFDVNVLVSAALFGQSTPRQVLDKAQDTGILLMSAEVLLELERVLRRSKFDRYLSLSRREIFVLTLAETAEFFEPDEKVEACRDPKDDKYLELAI